MQISLPEETNKNTSDQNILTEGTRRSHEFLAKFSHDWMMQLSAGLAYNLMVAIVPMGIAVIAVLGFTVGNLNPAAQAQLIDHIQHSFPSTISSHNILEPALTRLSKSAGLLSILAVVTAIFGGSRLFIAIERCFDIIYHTNPRRAIRQNLMALLMMLVFIVLIPIMVLASSLPAVIISLVRNSLFNQLSLVSQLAHNALVLSVASILGSLFVAWILFQSIYIVVPHQKISLKKSWKGALVAAILLTVFLALFPLYVTHFMSSYTGVAGFAIIFLLFFYYFAVILLFGAEVNAYFAEGVRPLPYQLATALLQQSIDPALKGQSTIVEQSAPPLAKAASQPDVSTSRQKTTDSQRQQELAARSDAGGEAVDENQTTPPERQLLAFLKRKKHQLKYFKGQQKKKFRPEVVLSTAVGTALAFAVTVRSLHAKTDKALKK
jgi:YihY family inner membrane protein